jgi:hypothetical protein
MVHRNLYPEPVGNRIIWRTHRVMLVEAWKAQVQESRLPGLTYYANHGDCGEGDNDS